MANRNFPNNKLYQFEIMPVLLSCNFVVDSTSPTGISNLKGSGILSVYMQSSSPSSENPNPEDGMIQIRLTDAYNKFLLHSASFRAPNSGTPLTAVVAETAYVITDLGTATLAQWQAVGLPQGVTPALGVAFIATDSATIGGLAEVQQPSSSGIESVEAVGDPNTTIISPIPMSPMPPAGPQSGGQLILQCLDSTGALAAPADGSVCQLSFYLSNSSITLAGQ